MEQTVEQWRKLLTLNISKEINHIGCLNKHSRRMLIHTRLVKINGMRFLPDRELEKDRLPE